MFFICLFLVIIGCIGDCTKFVVHNKFVGTVDGYNAGFYRSIIVTVLGLIGVIRDWDTVIIILNTIQAYVSH